MSTENKAYPRDEWTQCIISPNEDGQVEVAFDEYGDLLSISNMEPGSASHSRSYKGLNREKQLSLISGGNNLSFFQDKFLFENYERIYFIDTNDSSFCGKKSCSTAVYELRHHKEALANPNKFKKVCIKFLVGFYQFEVSEKVSGEKIGWHLFLESSGEFLKLLPNGKKALIVTDHALDEHKAINKQQKPYYLDFYLPNNIDFGYAKSDKSGSFLEVAMKQTDKLSNVIKADFKKYQKRKMLIHRLTYDINFYGYATILPKAKNA